ncbi:hypothetical protein ANCCAN_24273 [Ancylostoma caninum]|uniref:SCP domain-containing protein n=1 Tax=Ancylostoma caninum TaxID=29170 RepID=A0A368FD23_ANCCA|nr:hypothetical protein ANCCAN_24273 [Ancylostoma caninum]
MVITFSKCGFVHRFKSRKCTNITQKTNEILKGWWDQVRAVDLDAEQKYVAGLEKFGPMAAGQAKGFACALKDCSNIETELSCVYEKLYEPLLFTCYVSDLNNVSD